MRENIRLFVELVSRIFPIKGTVIEVGSLRIPGQDDFADLRPFFSNHTYIGCDISPGPGVDRIESAERMSFSDNSVIAVLNIDTIEHIKNPLKAVKEAYRILEDGGMLILSSVMNFPLHCFPSDYWRFTPEGLGVLLEDFPVRVVGAQGYELNPHTVYGIGFKTGAKNVDKIVERVNEFFYKFSSGLKELQRRISEQSSFKYRLIGEIIRLKITGRFIPRSISRLYKNTLYFKVYRDSELLSSFKKEIL